MSPHDPASSPRPAFLLSILNPRTLSRRFAVVGWVAILAALWAVACAAPPAEESGPETAGEPGSRAAPEASREVPEGPFIEVVGTVQDGGMPHAGCTCQGCELARSEQAQDRRVASLAIVLPESGRTYLIDATPDIGEQIHALRRYRPRAPRGRVDRAPLDGIFLTHAHMGHYLGLAQLGFEVMHTQGIPVYATPRMTAFLRNNGPWSQLLGKGNIDLREMPPGSAVELGEGVTVTSLAVPHRDEFSDTVAYRVSGPGRTVFYVPDTDSWDAWTRPLTEVLEGVDLALLDGTFYSLAELPGRSISSIGHPLIVQSLDLLEPGVAAGTLEVGFIHLNHSNPALLPASEARREIEGRGFGVVAEGERIQL